MGSVIDRHTADARGEAAYALRELTRSLDAAHVRLPSLGVDWRSARVSGTVLVELGAVRPDVALRLAAVVWAGSTAPWQPAVGEPVVDLASGRVGEFRGEADGRWWLRPRGGGREWDADPRMVRAAGERA
ncbi:hypothetical protein OG871_18255 [Kitasatospora sp. NBC_00374]|uniref:hypothetical protein n=1 Tax=Kitasatospora sp. NBC_00374 TaxID=2975964 RepID=UPI00324F9675